MRNQRSVHFNQLNIDKVIGKVGVEDAFIPETLGRHLDTLILTNQDKFNDYIEENYTLFSFDTLILTEEEKKALFARFVIQTSKNFDNESGVHLIKEDRFNGPVFIPREIVNGKVSVLRTNYFSRSAFIKSDNSDSLLSDYKKTLDDFDRKNGELLDKYYKGEMVILSLLERGIVTSQTATILLKIKDGYVYTTRNIKGEIKKTLITGIVDSLDTEDLVSREILEEVNVSSLSSVKLLGGTLSDSHSIFGSTTALHYNYLAVSDIDFDELTKLSQDAVDCYENEEIYFVPGDFDDFVKELDSYEEDLAIQLNSLLDGETIIKEG